MSLKYEKLIRKMTLAEKAIMMSGKNTWETVDFEKYGIPSMAMSDGPHGLRRQAGAGDHLGLNASLPATCFPTAAGVANSWDEALGEEIGEALAEEAVTMGVNVILGPGLNIKRSPLCGRNFEYFSEDPYHAGKMAAAYVRGIQSKGIAACPKHFAANSQELRRMANDSVVDERTFREIYTTGFEIAIKEGKSKSIMSSYNEVNGVYANENSHMLQEILVDEWGFDGFVVSDWGGSNDHALGVKNGSHLEMPGTGKSGMYDIIHAVENGDLDEAVLDQRLDELLNVIFSTHQATEDAKGKTFDVEAHHNLARKAAEESIVLLKNEDNFLPLDKSKLHTIGVIGPNADSRKALVGNYEGTASRYITVLEGIEDYVGDDVKAYYSEACDLWKDRTSGLAQADDRISEAKAVCEVSDVIIAVMGLDSSIEGEQGDAGNEFASGDKKDLLFPGLQREVLEVAYSSGKPVILVSMTGSAMALEWEDAHCKAILQAWYPGAAGGKAVAEAIFGEYSPEGKLPVTFYRTSEELPEFTDYAMKGRTYRYMEKEALYPFGFGLSYTSFEQGKTSADRMEIEAGGQLRIKTSVKNTGKFAGGQTIQVYVKALRDNTPNAQLKGLKKLSLQPGEAKEVEIVLADKAFALYDEDAHFMLEEGDYEVSVGMQQTDRRSSELTGQTCSVLKVHCSETKEL